MSMRIVLEPAFVLHTRAYRESSLIVELLTLNHGKISVIARSARGPRSRFKGALVPFAPLLISVVGKTDLLTLTSIEVNEPAYFLQGNRLFTGLYLNELLLRLLQKYDSFPNIFKAYKNTLHQLLTVDNPQIPLRKFELQLLRELGYGLQLEQEASGNAILSHLHYTYHFDVGLNAVKATSGKLVFEGRHLLAIAKQNFEDADILAAARRLLRSAIAAVLGDYQLRTRDLFL